MKRFPWLIFAAGIILTLGLSACSTGSSGSGTGDSGGSSGTVGSARTTLSNLPDPQTELPASLSEDSGTSAPSSLASMVATSSSDYEVSVVTADELPSTKAQGWYDMRYYTGLGQVGRAFYNALKAYAEDNDFETGVVITLGSQPFMDMNNDGDLEEMNLGQFIVEGTESDFTVYWKVNPTLAMTDEEGEALTDGEGNPLLFEFTGYIVLDVVETGDEYEIISEIQTTDGNRIYSRFNTATGNSLIYETCDNGGNPGPTCDSPFTTLAAAESVEGEISVVVFNEHTWDGQTWRLRSAAWGDNEQGGIRNYDQCIGDGCADSNQFSYKEYYDSNGILVRQDWGDTNPPIWVDKASAEDLKTLWASNDQCDDGTPPEAFFVVEEFNESGTTVYVTDNLSSTDAETACVVSLSLSESEFVYEWMWAESDGSAWAEGDASYGWAKSGPLGLNAWQTEYNLLLEVGAGEAFGGTTYYYSAQVPVKQLLPLANNQDLLAVDLGLQEYEGWSYRDVRYYVDDGPTAGELDGDPNGWNQGDEYDTALWDVFWMQNYVWTDEGAVETAAPWLQVRDAGNGVLAIPELFTDNPTRAALVLAVDTELDAVVNYFDDEGIIDPAFLARVDADFDSEDLDDLSQRSGFAALD